MARGISEIKGKRKQRALICPTCDTKFNTFSNCNGIKCPDCSKKGDTERSNKWYKNHKDYIKEYYQAHKEQIKEKQRQYNKTHKTQISENKKRYMQLPKTKELQKKWKHRTAEYRQKYRKEHPDKERTWNKKWRDTHKRVKTARKHNLTLEQYNTITQKCFVCGFSEIAELHHKDGNHDNSNLNNLIGLCPNHHQLIHRNGKTLEELTNSITAQNYQ